MYIRNLCEYSHSLGFIHQKAHFSSDYHHVPWHHDNYVEAALQT